MHLSVFERVRVVNLYNDLKGNESFTKRAKLKELKGVKVKNIKVFNKRNLYLNCANK